LANASRLVIALSGMALACSRPADRGETNRAVESTSIRTDSMASAGGGYTTTVTGALSDSIVHLAAGDSLEFQSFGPAQVTGQPEGLLVTYHPFVSMSDSVRIRRVAIVFFDSLRTKFRYGEPPFVVMRAVDLRASERMGALRVPMHAYGLVLEKRADGRWYGLHETSPIHP
jgi:hypothetical protein